MDGTEREQDDADVEITDIPVEEQGAINRVPTGRPARERSRPWAEQGAPQGTREGHPDHDRALPADPIRVMVGVPLAGTLRRNLRLLRRQRTLQIAVTVTLVALIVLVVVVRSATVREALVTGIVGRMPTPTPTLEPGSDLFYIQGAPPWGRAALDGHILTRLPVVGVDAPLRLARGQHVVEWRADPFLPQSCILAIPPIAGSDNCLSYNPVQLKSGLFASIITFSESLDMLSDVQRNALAKAAQSAINALQFTDTVQPGEQYIDIRSNFSADIATRPLHATLSFQLDLAPTSSATCISNLGRSVIPSCQDCRRFCTAPDQVYPASPTGQAWSIFALVSASWKFTTLDGQIVEQNQPDSPDEYLIELHIRWDGENWHVSVLLSTPGIPIVGNPVCESAQQEIGVNGYYGATGGDVEEAVAWQQFVSGPNLASGCLAVGTPQQGTSAAPHLPVAYLLYRFGIVVAGNDAAYRYWPSQPPADTYEQHLVQQLAALSPQQ